MTTAGLLTVRACFAEGSVAVRSVRLTRPSVARLFIGQNPDAVVKAVPYLYTLCAGAQRAAAQAATAQAQDEPRRPVDDGELWVELLHENLWRLLLDWPPACGVPAARDAFIAWRLARLGEYRLGATQELLAGTLHEVAEKCLEKLVDRSNPESIDLPGLAPEPWLACWQGGVSGVPKPALPPSAAAAFRKRLAEVEAATQALAAGSAFPIAAAGGAGWGVGQSLTARGVLTHAVHLEGGTVKKYRVWAPTDVYFADASGLAALLVDQQFADIAEARRGVDLAVLALDPCVPYEVELNDA